MGDIFIFIFIFIYLLNLSTGTVEWLKRDRVERGAPESEATAREGLYLMSGEREKNVKAAEPSLVVVVLVANPSLSSQRETDSVVDMRRYTVSTLMEAEVEYLKR